MEIKYVSYDPTHAYPASYQPEYRKAMGMGSLFLVVIAIIV